MSPACYAFTAYKDDFASSFWLDHLVAGASLARLSRYSSMLLVVHSSSSARKRHCLDATIAAVAVAAVVVFLALFAFEIVCTHRNSDRAGL